MFSIKGGNALQVFNTFFHLKALPEHVDSLPDTLHHFDTLLSSYVYISATQTGAKYMVLEILEGPAAATRKLSKTNSIYSL